MCKISRFSILRRLERPIPTLASNLTYSLIRKCCACYAISEGDMFENQELRGNCWQHSLAQDLQADNSADLLVMQARTNHPQPIWNPSACTRSFGLPVFPG